MKGKISTTKNRGKKTMKTKLFLAMIISLLILAGCTSESEFEIKKKKTTSRDSAFYRSELLLTDPLWISPGAKNILSQSHYTLTTNDCICLIHFGDTLKIIESYTKDKSFFPLGREKTTKTHYLYAERENTIVTHSKIELSMNWYDNFFLILGLFFSLLLGFGFSGVYNSIETDYGILNRTSIIILGFTAIACLLAGGFALGYFVLWVLIFSGVSLIINTGVYFWKKHQQSCETRQ